MGAQFSPSISAAILPPDPCPFDEGELETAFGGSALVKLEKALHL